MGGERKTRVTFSGEERESEGRRRRIVVDVVCGGGRKCR